MTSKAKQPGGFLRGVLQAGVDAKLQSEALAIAAAHTSAEKSKESGKKKKKKKDRKDKKERKDKKGGKKKKRSKKSSSSSSGSESGSSSDSSASDSESAGFALEAKEKIVAKGVKFVADLEPRQLAAAVLAMQGYDSVTQVNIMELGGELHELRAEQLASLSSKIKSTEPADITLRLAASRHLAAASLSWKKRLLTVLQAGQGSGWLGVNFAVVS